MLKQSKGENYDDHDCNMIYTCHEMNELHTQLVFIFVQVTALKIRYNPFAKAFLDAKERPDSHREFFYSPQCKHSNNIFWNAFYL